MWMLSHSQGIFICKTTVPVSLFVLLPFSHLQLSHQSVFFLTEIFYELICSSDTYLPPLYHLVSSFFILSLTTGSRHNPLSLSIYRLRVAALLWQMWANPSVCNSLFSVRNTRFLLYSVLRGNFAASITIIGNSTVKSEISHSNNGH